ncbi:MAG: sigma-54 dependent transcriptional regulator [Desulfobulbaceae bacterium]|nr:sigma-54 dependent transcriptional regulator [Desulfobulbaceae bacterium]
MKMILVVDDQETVVYSLKRLLELEGYQVITATSGSEAISLTRSHAPDLVVMDVKMPGMDGLEALVAIKEFQSEIPIIMMTAHSTIDKAVAATKFGAFDYLAKPFENSELLARIGEALKTREMGVKAIVFDDAIDFDTEQVIGKSSGMLAVYKQIGMVAATGATVLIKGESGTGKDLIARAIFHHSDRTANPFLAINTAAIPEQLLESELFGYERGSFTGAEFRKIGKFEQCDRGTIFLDEIGDMSLGLQAKLLRVLQDGCFERLGGEKTIKSDVRIIAATNKNLEEMVDKGLFREDLFYRLNVINIELPPLRERLEDIHDLTIYFIHRFNKKFAKNIKGITDEAVRYLQAQAWPGNVRELANVIQQAVVYCSRSYIIPECFGSINLSDADLSPVQQAVKQLVEITFINDCQGRFQEIINLFEREMVKKALEITDGNQVQAARMLHISRNTLRKNLA